MTALQVSTDAALKGGELDLPAIVGSLQLTIIQAERMAYNYAMEMQAQEGVAEAVKTTKLILPPNGIRLPKR